MCGVVGFFDVKGAGARAELLNPALDAAHHRGPDGVGVYGDDCVALGHRRLAIIDLDRRSDQPFFSADGRHVICFNGEIYNYVELRARLETRGIKFRTTGDTEVLLYWLREFGVAGLHHIEGAFAFALWDRKANKLTLARDRFGEKPLQYHWNGRYLSFASEFKSLFCLPHVDFSVNFQGVSVSAFPLHE